MKHLSVNLDLVRKYDLPGPRYTSYPTAVQFAEVDDPQPLIDDIRENNREPRPLSLYFHLPFCETLCWFCGCTTVIGGDHGRTPVYLDHLEKEIELTRHLLHPDRKVVQMHFGGGTPSFLEPAEIDRLGSIIHRAFNFEDGAECSVELDPRRLTREHVEAFARIGINRASIGIQDFNSEVQEAVNRIQPRAVTEQTVEWIREAGFRSVNFDLIYGLPHQNETTFDQTLEIALEIGPDRFAVFNYAHVPWMKPAQKLLKVLPGADTKLGMLKLVTEKLTSRGYRYIGMDHFARAGDELSLAQQSKTLQRNFQGYSTLAGADIYSFGMSSISQIDAHYRQNEKTLPEYYKAVDSGRLPISRAVRLNRDDIIRRTVIMRLMCDLELDFDQIGRELEIDFRDYFASAVEALGQFEADGLIEPTATGFQVTDMGRLLLRNLAMLFDAYLGKAPNRFSKTI
jgi:oxygen-independent coproporphyrinogen-3 oxidase